MTERTVRTVALPGGLDLPFVEQGDPAGPALVLLHGYADSWRSFELVLPHLPDAIHAFALTQRGHGDATKPASGYTTQDFAGDLIEFIDAVGIERAFVVGASSGGLAARRFAAQHPERTAGLILLGSPFTLRGNPGVRALWDSAISSLSDPVPEEFVRTFQIGTLARPIPEAFLETVVAESLKLRAHVWRETFLGLIEDDSDQRLNEVVAPTLIVWGTADTIVGRADQDALAAAIPNARLVAYEDAGHTLYWEDPERVVGEIAAFVRSVTV